jgi:glycosyltransferase involved in cell wall biosynthesis
MAKIYYFARINPVGAPGIYKKLIQTVAALEKSGHQSELIVANGEGGLMKALPSVMSLLTKLVKVKADVVIIRNDILMPLLSVGMIIQRIRGTRVVVDVPTPITNWINEINLSKHKSLLWRLRRTLLIRSSFPWSLWPASKVIQYAKESMFFSFGIRNKSLLSGNGIDIEGIPLRKFSYNVDHRKLVLIGVAALADWHGYDRVIRGIAEFMSANKTGTNVYFYIVGDGPVKADLEKLSYKLGIESNIKFFGFLDGKKLDEIYDISDMAVASLGLYRVGLKEASSLKSREYIARGLPIINSGRDVDFDPPPYFVFQVKNNSSNINIQDLILWHKSLNCDLDFGSHLRNYAKDRLSFHSKIKSLI